MASKKTEIPKHEIDTLAKTFLPEIIAFFETEEGKKEFEEWKRQREETRSFVYYIIMKNEYQIMVCIIKKGTSSDVPFLMVEERQANPNFYSALPVSASLLPLCS